MSIWTLVIGIGLALTAWLLEIWENRSQARTIAAYRAQLNQCSSGDE